MNSITLLELNFLTLLPTSCLAFLRQVAENCELPCNTEDLPEHCWETSLNFNLESVMSLRWPQPQFWVFAQEKEILSNHRIHAVSTHLAQPFLVILRLSPPVIYHFPSHQSPFLFPFYTSPRPPFYSPDALPLKTSVSFVLVGVELNLHWSLSPIM